MPHGGKQGQHDSGLRPSSYAASFCNRPAQRLRPHPSLRLSRQSSFSALPIWRSAQQLLASSGSHGARSYKPTMPIPRPLLSGTRPRCGASMIAYCRDSLLRNYQHACTPILPHSLSFKSATPRMCSGTPMHPCPRRTETAFFVGYPILSTSLRPPSISTSTVTVLRSTLHSFSDHSFSSPTHRPVPPDRRSNPIAHRVRRKRQRLPPSLLIENASVRHPAPPQKSAPRRFRSRLSRRFASLEDLSLVMAGLA